MDQVLAMEWARDNVAAFGGDPARVTLIGQSAGAMSISVHLSRPQTQGLYAGVIQHSNPFAEPWRSPPEALAIAAGFANFTGCGASWISQADWAPLEACLRALDVPTIVAAAMSAELDLLADLDAILQVVVAWGPTVGTDYLPLRPLEAFQRGLVNDVPIAVGTTANETVIFVYEVLDFPLPQLLYEAAIAVIVSPGALPEVMALYPLPTPVPADLRVFASYALTDGLFLCPTRNASEALLAAQPARRSPIFHFQYSHMISWASEAWGKNFTECDTQVCHGSDLPAWFMPRKSPAPGFGNYTQQELDLGHTWQRYWANFARTGDPGAASPDAPTGGLAWPAYDASSRQTLNFETADKGGVSIISGMRADYCAFWDKNGYRIY
jgi:para-nitrobenzyl esterase